MSATRGRLPMGPLPRPPSARKRFGQHFLHDAAVISRLIAVIDPQPGQSLVEIGPGRGALTGALLAAAGELHAVELDRDLVVHLRQRFAAARLHLHAADALRFDFAALAGDDKLRLVGNLPYNISTPLLFRLLTIAGRVQDMHFMLQKEVVDRLVAPPGGKDYGRLGVAVAARAQAECLFEVGAGAFSPPPKVRSAVVRLVPHRQQLPDTTLAAYDRLLAAAFGQRRKRLSNALKPLLNGEQIAACGIDPAARAETLTVQEFLRLAQALLASRETRVKV